MNIYIGYDIGAISVNRVIINSTSSCSGQIVDVMPYSRHYGEPVKLILKDIEEILKKGRFQKISGIAFTGSGGKNLAGLLGASFINEIEAIITAIKFLYPHVNTVIEIGGQDSKFIDLAGGDYAMNELCAAGTGSFLDQQASRFNMRIEEFCELALRSENPSTIAGRCSVFAKSDMIHLQQEGASDADIALGLCYAMARSFKSGIVKGKKFQPPIIFCGGVSFNKAMIRAFEDMLSEKLIIPQHQASIGAIGAALNLVFRGEEMNFDLNQVSAKLSNFLKNFKYQRETFRSLVIEKSKLPARNYEKYNFNIMKTNGKKVEAYIGIDVGSISTNVVAIDKDKKLISKVYLRTAGRPIEAVRKGIEIIGMEVGDRIDVKAVGTTGSGRYLIGDLVGADVVINEITAQATAAANIDPEVDTIFEIGGQDSKYISLENGVVVDFEMNKICAAGTGSFLEEQAERFGIKIEDFGERAMAATSPLNLGERCTVFMETNVYSHYQKGASIEDILAGLAYSIVINYINRVVGRKKIGNKIFFQGAVAFNKAVVAAFENYLGKEIIVPENHEVTGAIGAAIRALENKPENSRFRGFEEIANIKYSQSSFECKGCPNMCEIKRVTIEGSNQLFYGGRCEKYEKKKSEKIQIKDLFSERDDILLSSYKRSKLSNTGSKLSNTESKLSGNGSKLSNGDFLRSVPDGEELKIKIGIPFTMLTYEFYPFWEAFFRELGFDVVLSDKTNKKIIIDGLNLAVAETCFPMKVVLGHVQNLIEKGIDYLFIPSIRDMPCTDKQIEGERTGSYPCPLVQGISSFVKSSIGINSSRILDPLINFSFKEYLKNEQLQNLGKKLGRSKSQINKAIKQAYRAQEIFYATIRQKGEEALKSLREDEIAVVIISRPYNSCDVNISMDIPGKLRNIGLQAIPLDYLPLERVDIFHQWPNMYWEFGDRILRAVEIIKKDSRLYPVYITNFGCGPDSFIIQYFEREIDRPFLKIEIDEHTAGAGVITRCEAFYDSLKNVRRLEKSCGSYGFKKDRKDLKEPIFSRKEGRKIFIPYMGDGAYAIQAAFRSAGIDSEVMYSDSETLEFGRKYSVGKECYPFIITTGDILKTLKYNNPAKSAFLMPLTYGPCRFGQYNKMQKILLKELGYHDVPIIAPGAPESEQFYKEYDMEGARGAKLYLRALAGIFTIDYLNKFLMHVRPYEIKKGESQEIYNKFLSQVCTALENSNDKRIVETLSEIIKLAKVEFENVPVNRIPKPLIGIVGEIYIRNNPFSNNEIIKRVEELGGEVTIPDFSEWVYHTNATGRLNIAIKQKDLYYKILKSFNLKNNFSNGTYVNNDNHGKNSIFDREISFSELIRLLLNFARGIRVFLANRLFKVMILRYHHLLERPIRNSSFVDLGEADIYEIWDNAEPYIIKWFGEAALSVGKSVDWIKKGVNGIVNVLPFTCMPGTMVTAISKRIREEYRIPWLNLAFDGLEQGTTETRLEAFMYQAKQHKNYQK